MRSRRFTKQIELWRSTAVSDGFGGATIESTKVADIWANLQTLDKFRYSNTDLGTVDYANSIKVTTRDNPNIVVNYKTDFIIYRGENYFLLDNYVITNFEDNYVTFVMTKQN